MHPNAYWSTIYNSKDREQPKYPSTEECIKRMWYIYTVEYYIVLHTMYIKKSKIMSFAATWMNLEIIVWSEVSQKEKDKYHVVSLTITYMWNLKYDKN